MSATEQAQARETTRAMNKTLAPAAPLSEVPTLYQLRAADAALASELAASIDLAALQLGGVLQLLAAAQPGAMVNAAYMRALLAPVQDHLAQAQGCAQLLQHPTVPPPA